LFTRICYLRDRQAVAGVHAKYQSRDLTFSRSMRLIVVALAFTLACSAPGTVPVPTSASPKPSPTAMHTATPLVLAFERAATFAPAGQDSAVTGITAGGPGFVAVGFDGGKRAVVRVSADGRAWSAVESASFANATMIGVTRIGGRLVAFGRDVTSEERVHAAVWTSSDGASWRRAAESPAFDESQLVAAVPGSPGIVAVGGMPHSDTAAMWVSPDGEAWERVATFAHSFIWSVTAGGPGFVAVGWRRTDPHIRAAVWTSADGRTWTAAPPLPQDEAVQLRAVSAVRGMLVAVGDHTDGAFVYTSRDAVMWERTAMFRGTSLTAIVPTGGSVVAVGGSLTATAVALTSVDGRAWTPLEDDAFGNAYFTGVAADEQRVVAVGATQHRIEGTGSFRQAAAAWWSALR
jgi:hypothetical protein